MMPPEAAVNAMVTDWFEADDFPQIVGVNEHKMIDKLVKAVAQVTELFGTQQWGGQTGCLALIIDEQEMRRVTKNSTLNCGWMVKPGFIHPYITAKTTAVEDNQLRANRKVMWSEWYLQQSYEQHSIKAIVDSVDGQYIEENKM